MKIVEITYRYDASLAAVRARPATAQEALARLDDGSRALSALLDSVAEQAGTAQRVIPLDPRDLGLAPDGDGAPRQRPFAAVLGCSDARVPIELIFNEGPNDLFVIRVAGNGLGLEVLGSLKYAIDHLGGSLKLVVVLGHSGCGAVTAAVDVYLNPANYLPLAGQHALRNIVDRLIVVVNASAQRLEAVHGRDVAARRGYRAALIETAIALNAALAAYTVQQELGDPDPAGLRAAYGVYLVESRQVWAPRGGSPECNGLVYPPRESAAIREVMDAVVQSGRIAALLEGGR